MLDALHLTLGSLYQDEIQVMSHDDDENDDDNEDNVFQMTIPSQYEISHWATSNLGPSI